VQGITLPGSWHKTVSRARSLGEAPSGVPYSTEY
jgi:hypothetical protein